MAYLPLNNYNYDSGYRRIQSGPNHEQFIVLTSGSSAYGADNGFVVAGSPLSGTIAAGAWDYDDNWRYVPSTLPTQSGSLDPTPYNVSGALDTYDGTRIATRTSVAGAQAASAIGPEANVIQPRGAALQPRAGVTRPEKYMYFGGAAPDNQNYSPYNTPDANTAAEGKTGGPVTHRTYENTLITNTLGSQGTSDRSQWRYHQPVYCKTYTETVRSDSPGLMSTPLRYVYRGSATSYNYNYGGELLANKGGFEILNYDAPDFSPPPYVPVTTNIGPMLGPYVPGALLEFSVVLCEGAVISRAIGNVGDEQAAVVETVAEPVIPVTPPISLGGTNYTGKFVLFSFTCPNGDRFIADSLTVTTGSPITVTSRDIGFPGALPALPAPSAWSNLMKNYAITFRLTNVDGATDFSVATFNAQLSGTYSVTAAADDTAYLTVNGSGCQVGPFQSSATTNVIIERPKSVTVPIVIQNLFLNDNTWSGNPMGLAFIITGPV